MTTTVPTQIETVSDISGYETRLGSPAYTAERWLNRRVEVSLGLTDRSVIFDDGFGANGDKCTVALKTFGGNLSVRATVPSGRPGWFVIEQNEVLHLEKIQGLWRFQNKLDYEEVGDLSASGYLTHHSGVGIDPVLTEFEDTGLPYSLFEQLDKDVKLNIQYKVQNRFLIDKNVSADYFHNPPGLTTEPDGTQSRGDEDTDIVIEGVNGSKLYFVKGTGDTLWVDKNVPDAMTEDTPGGRLYIRRLIVESSTSSLLDSFRGPWVSATKYSYKDVVERNGIYFKRKNHDLENMTVDPATDTGELYWKNVGGISVDRLQVVTNANIENVNASKGTIRFNEDFCDIQVHDGTHWRNFFGILLDTEGYWDWGALDVPSVVSLSPGNEASDLINVTNMAELGRIKLLRTANTMTEIIVKVRLVVGTGMEQFVDARIPENQTELAVPFIANHFNRIMEGDTSTVEVSIVPDPNPDMNRSVSYISYTDPVTYHLEKQAPAPAPSPSPGQGASGQGSMGGPGNIEIIPLPTPTPDNG